MVGVSLETGPLDGERPAAMAGGLLRGAPPGSNPVCAKEAQGHTQNHMKDLLS